MFENFMFSANAIVPIFALVFFGYFLRQKKYIDPNTIKQMNTIVFKFALPAMLFTSIAKSNFKDAFDLPFLIWLITITIATFLFAWGFAEIFMKDKPSIGAFVQGSFRGNYAILGLSVISNILGDADTGKSVLVTTFVVPLYNILSVFILTIRSNNTVKDASIFKTALLNIVKNPLIIGITLGLPFSFLGVRPPVMIYNTCQNLANLTMPLALIAIGGNIDFRTSFTDIRWAVIATSFKEFLFPIVSVLISALCFNMRGEELVIVFVMMSTPTAVTSYIMATNMGSNGKLASNIILFTTLVSLFTFAIGIYILKTLSWI